MMAAKALARGAATLLASGAVWLGAALSVNAADLVFDTAILQGMDKVTGRVMNIEIPVKSSVRFGPLEIVVQTCRKHPPEEQPEAAAFLDIWEHKPEVMASSLFRGWMFASSPALSAMEHPVYDIWVVDCVNRADKTPKPAQ